MHSICMLNFHFANCTPKHSCCNILISCPPNWKMILRWFKTWPHASGVQFDFLSLPGGLHPLFPPHPKTAKLGHRGQNANVSDILPARGHHHMPRRGNAQCCYGHWSPPPFGTEGTDRCLLCWLPRIPNPSGHDHFPSGGGAAGFHVMCGFTFQ